MSETSASCAVWLNGASKTTFTPFASAICTKSRKASMDFARFSASDEEPL